MISFTSQQVMFQGQETDQMNAVTRRPSHHVSRLGHTCCLVLCVPYTRPRSDSEIFFSLARGEISLAFLA